MDYIDKVKNFYLKYIPGAKLKGNHIQATCPFCRPEEDEKPGVIAVYVNPDSFFAGYFRCSNRCTPGGFPLYFGNIMGIEAEKVPGYDPDREPYVRDMVFPTRNLNTELLQFISLMDKDKYEHFADFGISKTVIDEMKIGYNGRYLVYPYFMENGNCYAARCILPARELDTFWYGDKKFFTEEFRIFNVQEIDRCEGGAMFITDSENNLMTLKELGYPGIAVPSVADLDVLTPERLAYINHIFMVTNNSPEAQLTTRSLATRLGFKVRLLKWPTHLKRDYNLVQLSRDKGEDFRTAVSMMIKKSKAFSPFTSPEKEYRGIIEVLEREKGKNLLGLSCGFKKMDRSLSGIRGINIMGGPPKAGKSCFFMQVSTEMARRKNPVIYYDFENGRQTIYTRTLCRLSRLSGKEIRMENPDGNIAKKLMAAQKIFKEMLRYFRLVTDRKLNPDIMRRQIDFIQHETHSDYTVVVVDSLHKLPFQDLSDRRTGIDSWLRHMESIRDEQNVSFFVVSELSRGEGGSYSDKPDLGSFKESGDIEYSADNAMILMPDWDLLDPISTVERKSTLWLAASRENSPGKVAEYSLEYPYWGFREI